MSPCGTAEVQNERLNEVLAMQNTVRRVPVGMLGLALLCFLLPFVTVSCSGQEVVSFTGVQLVFGTTVPQAQMIGPPQMQSVDPEPLAVVSFLCCLAAFGLSFIKSRKGEIGTAALAGASFVALMMLKSTLEDEVAGKAMGALRVEYETGFWLVTLLVLGAGALAALAPFLFGNMAATVEESSPSPPQPVP